jgi:hypothetical protein
MILLVCALLLTKATTHLLHEQGDIPMLDNFRFQAATLSAQDLATAPRGRQPVSLQGVKRVFHLGGDRRNVRQAGLR